MTQRISTAVAVNIDKLLGQVNLYFANCKLEQAYRETIGYEIEAVKRSEQTSSDASDKIEDLNSNIDSRREHRGQNRGDIKRIGQQLAKQLEAIGKDTTPLLQFLHAVGDFTGGGPDEALKLWPQVKVSLQRLTLKDSPKGKGKTPGSKASPSKTTGKQQLLIAGLTEHHRPKDDTVNYEPIGSNKLAEKVGVSASTASKFFNKKFGGPKEYRAQCADGAKLDNALKLLNGEVTPRELDRPLRDANQLADDH